MILEVRWCNQCFPRLRSIVRFHSYRRLSDLPRPDIFQRHTRRIHSLRWSHHLCCLFSLDCSRCNHHVDQLPWPRSTFHESSLYKTKHWWHLALRCKFLPSKLHILTPISRFDNDLLRIPCRRNHQRQTKIQLHIRHK